MYSGLTVPPSLLALADEVMNNDPFLLHCMSPLLCRFSDAGMPKLSTCCGGQRPKSAKARNRGVWGTEGAAGAMGIRPRREC